MGLEASGGTRRLTVPPLAITGATGFIGRSLLAQLGSEAPGIAALARNSGGRTLAKAANLTWVPGDLDDPAALDALVRGAEVVIHLAGATKATSPAMFRRINATATAALVSAAARAGVRHFILLSSLAVMRPEISDYAASKAAGETEALRRCGAMPVSIIRAPAVFGPGDSATAPLFSLIAKGWLPVPGGPARTNQFSVIDVEDLCRELVELIRTGPSGGGPISPYGARRLGWPDIAESCRRVLGRPIRQLVLPGPLLSLMAKATDFAGALTGHPQVFSSGKLREMASGDWIADHAVRAPTPLDSTLARCIRPHLGIARSGTVVPDKPTGASNEP